MTLVVVDTSERCPHCGHELRAVSTTKVPLFKHGGYGAGRRESWRQCRRCGWFLTYEIQEVRP